MFFKFAGALKKAAASLPALTPATMLPNIRPRALNVSERIQTALSLWAGLIPPYVLRAC
jgi:hypothetical protein